MSEQILSVGSLVHYLKGRLEGDAFLQNILVEGEISNFSSYRSGHWYFSIKDSAAQMRCVMFSSANRQVKFAPKDGDQVLLRCHVAVYEGRGEMQLLVMAMKPIGQGELYLRFEALKKKLEAQGLFEEAHKKAIPAFPMRIALVTGKNTAARADVLNTLARRWPLAEIGEYPVLVQGNQSAEQMIKALSAADQAGFDVILLVRGGGSIEDLWSFNDEALAKTIYTLKTPLITGIGHEVDFTIADFAADLRAPTPTAAAERCAPDRLVVLRHLKQLHARLKNAVHEQVEKKRIGFDSLKETAVFMRPQRLYSEREFHLHALKETFMRRIHMRMITPAQKIRDAKAHLHINSERITQQRQADLEKWRQRLQYTMEQQTATARNRLSKMAALLEAYSPLHILKRGYAIASIKKSVIRSVAQTRIGEKMSVRLQDGILKVQVNDIKKESMYGEEGKDV